MRHRFLAALLLAVCIGAPAAAHSPVPPRSHGTPAREAPRAEKPPVKSTAKPSAKSPDYSGKKRKGKASFYARRFGGQKMADGTRLNLGSNAAASKTLPLGTKARVTNLDNGKSAVVEIRDRGPHVKGRIIDLTPRTARQLDMKEDGVARVEVQPLELPAEEQRRGPP
jgi:rare lipoprotein A